MEQARSTGTLPQVGTPNAAASRRTQRAGDRASIWRPAFVHDIDKILHCPYYNRCTDKTQVFSLIRNDDITRRSLHVQLVSRIARTIGSALNLNLELIEAIALGHDIGHPAFAHAGEVYLDELYYRNAGRHFCHNLHSVRVLDGIYPYNITLQTLSGIAGHNGEIEMEEYWPEPMDDFQKFDNLLEQGYVSKACANRIQPSTLEGCVVRISDIIAYLGKDRQDAARVNIINEEAFVNEDIGSLNSEIINNLVVNIIENSYGKPYIKLDQRHFTALQESKRDNYAMIYAGAPAMAKLDSVVRPMMAEIYGQMLEDLRRENRNSPIYLHHINYVNQSKYKRKQPYEAAEHNQLVVDYIASMTDDYFIDLHHYLFPSSALKVEYKGYFDEMRGNEHV
jgi:dGTPase